MYRCVGTVIPKHIHTYTYEKDASTNREIDMPLYYMQGFIHSLYVSKDFNLKDYSEGYGWTRRIPLTTFLRLAPSTHTQKLPSEFLLRHKYSFVRLIVTGYLYTDAIINAGQDTDTTPPKDTKILKNSKFLLH